MRHIFVILFFFLNCSIASGQTNPDDYIFLMKDSSIIVKPLEELMIDKNQEIDFVIDSLIVIAADTNLYPIHRRAAIFLLGKSQNKKGLKFLIDNIDLYLMKLYASTESEKIKLYPCMYALGFINDIKTDWNIIPLILESLKKPKTDLAIEKMVVVLRRFGDRRAMKELLSSYAKNYAHVRIYGKNLKKISELF